MNKNGQAAIILIILIPVFMIIAAIIIDTTINISNEKKLKNVTEDVITSLLETEDLSDVDYDEEDEVIEKLKEKAERIYESNEINVEYLNIELTYNGLSLSNSHTYYSFMNSLFGKGNGNRQIFIEASGYLDSNNKVVIEFKGDAYEN